ncbi:MAG: flagellar biosynthetic protein FliR [Bacteroidales bacterium]|nr:flagellar biosynthetic protein FliR [Bacteroidales bacterium]MCM1415613.1 flagellar biosynthetic protein FliR [bacterium]MCM1423006.1 flagellar biosynthetic protein FliR [bacterium]
MIDISFTYADLEYFLLILVRISCFVYAAPFFSMSNVPRTVKIGFSLFLSYLLFHAIDRNEVVYESLLGYAVIVMKEALTGFVIGWGAQICATVTSFAGSIADMEIGLSMVSLLDPATREQATFTGVFYQYMFTLFMIISGLYQYLLSALVDTFTLIPINGAVFKTEALMSSILLFLGQYVSVGFRIILPIFCAMIFLNCVLGVLAKVSPQLNMFAVGIQFKVLVGLGILFLSVQMLPTLADNIFTLMKRMIVSFVEGMI